jgi:hypothetical protein
MQGIALLKDIVPKRVLHDFGKLGRYASGQLL